jgi:EAL domain-containing protein (putative c-di-GMP-specific phosphodiesterase class I)
MSIDGTAFRWDSGTDIAASRVTAEQAAEIVALAAQLLRVKSRIHDLDALNEFAIAQIGEIHEAIGRDAFCYFYQPILSAATGLVEGHEALLRWQRRGEAFGPPLFLPIAEEAGSLAEIQQRLLDDVALAFVQVGPTGFISMNWSPRQFLKASAVSALIDRIKELKIDPARVVVEITARSTMIDPDLVYFCVQQLKDTGCRIALDDFGGPHGSLSYLSQLPIDLVKLDAALIADVERSERGARTLSAIIDFAHQLGAGVLAKGVETQQQIRILRRHGCDLLQGHAIGSPAREPQLIKVDG